MAAKKKAPAKKRASTKKAPAKKAATKKAATKRTTKKAAPKVAEPKDTSTIELPDEQPNEPTYGADFYARLFSLTARRIQQLAADGIIPKAARGQYPILSTVKGYVGFLQKQSHMGGDGQDTYAAENTRLRRAQREKIEIEMANMAGELIPGDEYFTELSKVLKTVGATIGSLPDILERDCGLNPEALVLVEAACEQLQEDLYDKLSEIPGGEE